MSATGPGAADVKVSVAMITYNHERFIAQAIESVLLQQTDFKYELVIGEDCSTDGTRTIVCAYGERYPERIRLLLLDHNQGFQINSVATLSACEGRYIAILEGDDYWIDPHKLQKQIDFLEANPEYSGSAHQSLVKAGDSERLFNTSVRSDIVLADLLDGRIFHTASLVFRREIITKHQIPPSITSVDRALIFQIASYGPIHYFDDVMCFQNEG